LTAPSSLPPNLRVGTSSWFHEDWAGPFYPPGARSPEFLSLYAGRFDTVEIDSTFYRIPSARMVDGWRERTPEGFIFAAKVPQVITHEKQLEGCEGEMNAFLEVMSRLGPKLGPLLLQFPYFPKGKGPAEYASGDNFRERLARFLDRVPQGFRIAVEVRNEPWLRPPLLDTLKARGAALTLLDYYTLPPIGALLERMDPVTAKFIYARLIGNHQAMDRIVEKRSRETGDARKWDRLALDRAKESAAWAGALWTLCPRVDVAYVFVNNHYAGYAPGSIDLLLSLFAEAPHRG